MGFGLGRELGENAQAIIPGGLGLGRGPWGLGFKPSVGRGSKLTWRVVNGPFKLAVSTNVQPKPQPTPAKPRPPYPLQKWVEDLSFEISRVNQCPTQAPPYPIGEIFENRVTDLTCDEFFSYGPQREAGSVGKTLVRKVNGNVVGWDVESDDRLCSLQEAFEKVNPKVGFNVELKFDDNVDYKQDHLIHALQVILKVVNDAKERPIIFSSFQPDAALLIKKLQQRYPVYFLTNGGTELYNDVRRNSLEEAKKVALEGGLDGIVSEVKGVFRNPSAVREIKEANLSLLTYGKLNNYPETVHVQRLMGVDGVIVDLVEEITRAVDETNMRKGRGGVEKGENGGIELSFLLNLISQVIQH
ncbi:putative glycerophosphodiester phosphodiesterase [Helianthus anomalus]